MTSHPLETRIQEAWPTLDPSAVARIVRFHGLLVAENERQNLTKLISPEDFVSGHLLDVRELHAFGQVGFPAMDLGSGGGVPGLLSALIREDRWVLAESEKMKANFLRNVVEEMGLPHVEVVADRAEAWLRSGRVDSIVARAVGKIQKIFAWIEHRSTWNNLILLKGPGWEAEWAEFQATPARNRLRVVSEHRYEVGADHKKRVIIRIERNVPRGTMATR